MIKFPPVTLHILRIVFSHAKHKDICEEVGNKWQRHKGQQVPACLDLSADVSINWSLKSAVKPKIQPVEAVEKPRPLRGENHK